MTEIEIKNRYNEICTNLALQQLKPAFDNIKKLIYENSLHDFADEYRIHEETYHYILKYTVEGIHDPERQKIYLKLIVSVFQLADKIYETLRIKFSFSFEYEKKRGYKSLFYTNFEKLFSELEDYYRNNKLKPLSENDELNVLKQQNNAILHYQKLVYLFYNIWFRDELTGEEIDFLIKFFASPLIEVQYKSLIVSALMLSLQRYFCPEKFSMLFDLYDSDEIQINQRAMVALLINFFKYDKRIRFYSAINGRLKIISENHNFKRDLEHIIIQFIKSKETEKIQKKIQDEIIPEMIKISPILKDKISLDSLMEECFSEDKNPEWEEIFEDFPGFINKMEEFSELQMEGVDIFVSSFAMLKVFPFFSEMSNWFVPFFPENPEIVKAIHISDETTKRFIQTIDSAPVLCNSDKYSFCLSIKNLPFDNREFIVNGMKAEMDQFNEIEKDEEITSPSRITEFISNQYIQDLYRFYKLHPQKSGFDDIFRWRFDFHKLLTVGSILKENPKILRNIAEYYFCKNYFDEAVEIYNYLVLIEKSGEIYQKIAFCYQKSGDYKSALDSYIKAELYEFNTLWNFQKIALCYRNLKQPAKALEYYRLAEKIDLENLNIQLSIGHCLLELELFEDALKCYFKVEYLSPGNKKVWRPIGWCSFVTGKKQQAEKYFQKLIDDKPNKHDLMNMGHVKWSLGFRKEALDYYKKAIEKINLTEHEFFNIFGEDLHYLLEQGVNKDDVPIMLDQLRYFIEG